MEEPIFFIVGVVSGWAIGVLSHEGFSRNPRTRMYLTLASVSALIASTAGMLQKFLETLNF